VRTEDAVKHFGSQAALARTLRITRSAVSQWGDRVPERQALRLQALTLGQLVADDPVLHRRPETAE
jgi:DNA-binding transcriptional regulator YdaS (Cro superfamily)